MHSRPAAHRVIEPVALADIDPEFADLVADTSAVTEQPGFNPENPVSIASFATLSVRPSSQTSNTPVL
jgi:hypothetical protein